MSLDKSDREPGLQFISNCQKDFDTLSEQSPDIVNIEDSDNISINI